MRGDWGGICWVRLPCPVGPASFEQSSEGRGWVRNPTPLLAQWWLNLEHRGSTVGFFHLKLIHMSCKGQRPQCLQGSSSCWLRAKQFSFVPFSLLPPTKELNASPPHISLLCSLSNEAFAAKLPKTKVTKCSGKATVSQMQNPHGFDAWGGHTPPAAQIHGSKLEQLQWDQLWPAGWSSVAWLSRAQGTESLRVSIPSIFNCANAT